MKEVIACCVIFGFGAGCVCLGVIIGHGKMLVEKEKSFNAGYDKGKEHGYEKGHLDGQREMREQVIKAGLENWLQP
jgi:hypothetical protein